MISIFSVFLFYLFYISAVPQEIVISVHDGDTIKTKIKNIRLLYCDAPEIKQEWGIQAREYLKSKVLNKKIKLIVKGTDKYGRSLSEVWVRGVLINKDLIAAGNAWVYYSKNKDLLDLQSQAQKNKLGLWSQETPIPPWEFRKHK
jgi:endonuclease YncB( thermonuclease family)